MRVAEPVFYADIAEQDNLFNKQALCVGVGAVVVVEKLKGDNFCNQDAF